MADKTEILDKDIPLVAEEVKAFNFKNFLDKNGKKIIAGVIGFAIGVAAFYTYKSFVTIPKIEKANVAVFPIESFFDKMAQAGFNKDSIAIAINGGVVDSIKVEGLINIVKKHSGTPAGNRAEYMLGACYLHNKEFDKAIAHLKEFDANGAYQIEIKKHMMLGHANAELKKTDEALSEYKKAANVNTKDEPFTTDALITAASYAQSLGKTKEAVELYENIKNNFPASQLVQSGDVDKYLAQLGVTK